MFEGLRGMLALPEDPNERAAAKQGLLSAGAAMMSSRGQNFLGAAGEGLGAGAQGYQGALQQQQQDQLRQAQTQQAQAQTQKTQADLARPALIGGIFNKRFSRPDPAIIKQSLGGAPNAVTPLSQVQKIGQQPTSDTPQPTSLPGEVPPAQLEALYRGMAHDYAAAGELELADKFIGYADNQKRKLMKRETLVKNGKPVSVLTYEDGQEAASEFEALPNNQMVDQGGSHVIVDLNMPQAGKTFKKSATPDTLVRVAQDERNSRRSDETTRRGQDFNNERAKETLAVKQQFVRAPTEFQGKSAAFGLRAAEADKTLVSLTGQYRPAAINSKNTVGKTWLVGGALEAGTNLALTDSDQRAEQAQRDFINAVLRQESGAAIADSEFDNARRQYFPQPGDGEAVIKQKARNRQLAIQGLQNNAGRAGMTAPPQGNSGGATFLGFE